MLDELYVFLKIAESNSMTEAARALHLSSATVARKLASLEEKMGAKLLERNTRSLSLTREGLHCYQRCQVIPQIIDEMKNTLTTRKSTLKGTVNISIACYSGFNEIIPKFIEFNQEYPGIVLNITKSNIFPDLVDDSYDVYIRYGEINTRSLTSTPLTNHQTCICASKVYLKQAPRLDSPYDISAHRCIVHRYNKYEGDEWVFMINGKKDYIRINSPLILNNSALVLESVIEGGGLASLPDYFVKRHNNLKVVLKEYMPTPETVYIVYPRAKNIFERTKVLVNFLIQSYQSSTI